MMTCNVTYYNEPHFLDWWYKTIKRLNEAGYPICFNLCDDGSMRNPAVDYFEKHAPLPNMQLYRVVNDIGFNSHGSRNLLMKQTSTEWNLLSDIDRHYDDDTLISMNLLDDVERGVYYNFTTTHNRNHFTLNEYFIHKDDFWLSGGYDEELVNVHWGDRLFFSSALQRVCKREVRIDWICEYVRGARDVSVGPVSTTQYPDDNTLINPENFWWCDKNKREAMIEFIKLRNSSKESRLKKPTINFEWIRVF